METIFLACFLFGVLFTLTSVILGFAGSVLHAPGDMHMPHHVQNGHIAPGPHHGGNDFGHHGAGDHGPLPILNISSLLGFLTWFGAAGYLLTRFAGWAAVIAVVPSVVAGAVGAFIIAAFIRKLVAGEREMRPSDYRLEGTIGRVSVTIPAGGVGEVLFSLAGSHRSEAARSLSGRAIPRDSEVVIIEYEHGIAAVQPWDELVGRTPDPGERRLPSGTDGQ